MTREADRPKACPDCDGVSRRDFLRSAGALAVAGGVGLGWPRLTRADQNDPIDSYIGELYKSMTADQRKVLCFPYEHELRKTAKANWNITEPDIDDLEVVQQDLVEKIVRSLTSEEGFEKFMVQMGDDHQGLGSYHIAIFGDPTEKGPCELVLTGRHVTMRADANHQDGVAFAGPMVYGHAANGFNESAGHPGNVFWYQAERANEVFKALDPKQREKALCKKAPDESQIDHRGSGFEGLQVGAMSSDQQALVKGVMADLLSPYRKADADEVLEIITANGGLEKIHLAFYSLDAGGENADIGSDGVWDIWRLEGPGFVWHFRGAPHVHTWVNIAKAAPAEKT